LISKKNLKDLASKRFLDAKALFEKGRYQGCVYIAGYTIELLLKYNICRIFGFSRGFPESKSEFDSYSFKIKKTFQNASSIKKFKMHDFIKLLEICGKEYDVKAEALFEWFELLAWSPEMRYLNRKLNKKDAEKFLNSVNKIRSILLK